MTKHAEKLGVKPSETLLDRSYHHAAMKGLPGAEKRGRPDILHFALMEALSTPLFFSHRLSVYVHTVKDKVITIADDLRLPKSYFRFEGLMMDLFRKGTVKSDEGKTLLQLADMTLDNLFNSVVRPEKVIGLSVAGMPSSAYDLAKSYAATNNMNTAFVVGGFPHSHFSERTTRLLSRTYSINNVGLEAHVVIARLVYECEKAIGLTNTDTTT